MVETPSSKLNSVSLCFLVEDVVKTAEYYRDVLGFSFERYWGEPPCFVILSRDAVEVFLSAGPKGCMRPNRVAHPEFTWDAYVRCRNVDALYQEFKTKGVKITREPEVAFYEMKEFEMQDCNGYTLCFAQNTQGTGG
jgi:predicted enzyme related to lactoylglutathione lyase